MIPIKNRDGVVIFTSETATTIEQAAEEAVSKDAYLADAYLADAYLAGADLAGAYLAGADLAGADRSDPVEPYKRPETTEDYVRIAQRFRERRPEVPVVEHLDSKILRIIESGEGALEMANWHACETTHCRAGWAIHLAGKAGYELEAKYGSHHAGSLIYRASVGRAPHFFATNERALEDIRRSAALEAAQ